MGKYKGILTGATMINMYYRALPYVKVKYRTIIPQRTGGGKWYYSVFEFLELFGKR